MQASTRSSEHTVKRAHGQAKVKGRGFKRRALTRERSAPRSNGQARRRRTNRLDANGSPRPSSSG
eukprot:2778520-Prymnesium_polylepis.1